MKESLQEIAHKWFRQAEYDLRDAELALNWGSFNLSCFLSQQSAEKAMKALLFYHGYEVVRGHSVGALCELIVSREPDFSNLVSAAKWLDKFYIPTRYPDALPDGAIPSEVYDREDAERALAKARKILDAVKEKIFGAN